MTIRMLLSSTLGGNFNTPKSGESKVSMVQVSDFDTNFERAVDLAFDSESSVIISNSSIFHAKYLISKLILKAVKWQEDVKISTGTLNQFVYESPDVLDATKKLLDTGAAVTVIVEDDIEGGATNEFKKLISASPKSSIYKKAINSPTNGAEGMRWSHFTLIGDKAFRLETSHASARAYGCFNNIDYGQKLQNLFEIQLTNSQIINT